MSQKGVCHNRLWYFHRLWSPKNLKLPKSYIAKPVFICYIVRNNSVCTGFVVTSCAIYLHTPLEHKPREAGGGGNGSRTAKRAVARENKVPSQRTLNRRAKKAREAAAAEDYGNVGPHADDIGESDIHDIGVADNDDVSVGMGIGSSGAGVVGGANAESLPTVDARAVPLPSFCPPSAYCDPHDRTGGPVRKAPSNLFTVSVSHSTPIYFLCNFF